MTSTGKRGSCSLCARADRAAIDSRLILGSPLRAICEEFGVKRSSLHRHSKHVKKAAENAVARATLEYSKSLRGHMAKIQRLTLEIAESAKVAGNSELALSAIREARANAECMRKLLPKGGEAKPKAKPDAGPVALSEYIRSQGAA